MPTAPEYAFKEKSTKLLILLPLRTIKNRHFNVRHPVLKVTYSQKIFVCIQNISKTKEQN